jgi:hypothetical protein
MLAQVTDELLEGLRSPTEHARERRETVRRAVEARVADRDPGVDMRAA